MSLGPGGPLWGAVAGLGTDPAHCLPPDPAEHLKLQVVSSSALVKEGDNVTLVCETDGNPQPVFSFFKKNVRPEGSGTPLPWQTSPGQEGVQWLRGRGPVWG